MDYRPPRILALPLLKKSDTIFPSLDFSSTEWGHNHFFHKQRQSSQNRVVVLETESRMLVARAWEEGVEEELLSSKFRVSSNFRDLDCEAKGWWWSLYDSVNVLGTTELYA